MDGISVYHLKVNCLSLFFHLQLLFQMCICCSPVPDCFLSLPFLNEVRIHWTVLLSGQSRFLVILVKSLNISYFLLSIWMLIFGRTSSVFDVASFASTLTALWLTFLMMLQLEVMVFTFVPLIFLRLSIVFYRVRLIILFIVTALTFHLFFFLSFGIRCPFFFYCPCSSGCTTGRSIICKYF